MSDARFFNLGIPQLPQVTDPKIEPDLRDVYFALRNISYLMGQYLGFEQPEGAYQNNAPASIQYTAGFYKRRIFLPATEAIAYGAMVNTFLSAGVYSARNADATTNAKPAHGICNTTAGVALGAIAEIVLPSCYVTSIGGLVEGTRYFLAAAAGGLITNVPPVGAGNVREALGIALAPTIFYFHPDYNWA